MDSKEFKRLHTSTSIHILVNGLRDATRDYTFYDSLPHCAENSKKQQAAYEKRQICMTALMNLCDDIEKLA